MTRLQLLLGKLAEEASEVAQIALKTQQFGLHELCPGQPYSNAERTHKELNDLLTIVGMLNKEFNFGFDLDMIHISNKERKVNKYYFYSQSLGLVN